MLSIAIMEPSQVAEARRRAAVLAGSLGYDETAAGRVAIVTTELATNMVKYGGPGEMLLGTYEDETGHGIQILALDRGAGMASPAHAQQDGYSTGGSPGQGLGAVKRQSQAFDIASWPGLGTAVLARVAPHAAQRGDVDASEPFCGAAARALKDEPVSGDVHCVLPDRNRWAVLVADGLGHGPHAAMAAEAALTLFRHHIGEAPGAILAAIHAGLGHTRGCAVSVCRLDPEAGIAVFSGIGNVGGAVVTGGKTIRTVSLAGTAGQVARTIREFTYPFGPGSLFVMQSDGVAASWSLDRYPGLGFAHPSLIAGVLYRDFGRPRDDATVLVCRAPPA